MFLLGKTDIDTLCEQKNYIHEFEDIKITYPIRALDRPAPWLKIQKLIDSIEKNGVGNLYVYLDLDIRIFDFNINFEDFINEGKIINTCYNVADGINTGAIIISVKTKDDKTKALDFLNTVWNETKLIFFNPSYEEAAVMKCLGYSFEERPLKIKTSKFDDFTGFFKPGLICNPFCDTRYIKEQHKIFHWARIQNPSRLKLMTEKLIVDRRNRRQTKDNNIKYYSGADNHFVFHDSLLDIDEKIYADNPAYITGDIDA